MKTKIFLASFFKCSQMDFDEERLNCYALFYVAFHNNNNKKKL